MRYQLKTIAAGLACLGALSGPAHSQDAADVALVNAMQGDISYQSKDGQTRKAQPYMRLRHGDKITLPAAASMRVSYTTANRQESWAGPGVFVATSSGGELLKGNKPEVVQLPAAVPQKLARVNELMNTSRVGGLVVRSLSGGKPASNEELMEAMTTYESMRASAPPSDVTPELFLYSVFQEHGMIDDLKVVARQMLMRQPDNPEIQRLANAALNAK